MNNIRKLREERKQSAEELGAAIGKSQPTISKWENSDNLSYENAKLIADYYKIPVYEVTGEAPEEYMANNPITKDMAEIEIIDATASCGYGIENFHPVVVGKQLISYPRLREITNSRPENIKILKIRGDSMEPTINDSDVIWVDVSYKAPSGDGLYLFCIGEELFVKRLQIDFINKTFLITSDNPKYRPIETKENVLVLGKVISITKMLG